jgi:hypothetical protein
LLDRIHKYETLLRKNHIKFESLKSTGATDTVSLNSAPVDSAESDDNSENEEEEHGSTSATPKEANDGKYVG